MKSSFENLLSLSQAADLWHLEESTLRKAISSNKFIIDEDVKNFGKQWIIRKEAMERVYGFLDKESIMSERLSKTKIQQIYYFIFECFNGYCKKYRIDYLNAKKDFDKYNIPDYLYDCYDYLHIENINETIKDIKSRIKRKIIYD